MSKIKTKSVRTEFYKNFVKTTYGYIKINGGYSDFIKFNNEYQFLLRLFGEIPTNTITFYHKPDFKNFQTCEQMYDWLNKKGCYPNEPITNKQYKKIIINILIKILKGE